jgi:glycosyltransferase involved in cell wall biosynthesis
MTERSSSVRYRLQTRRPGLRNDATPMNLPPRLIIADPGLRGPLGHHLGYSLAVAEAALAYGIAPLVLTSEEFRGAVPGGIHLRPSFAAAYQSAGGGGALRRAVFGLAARSPVPVAARVAPLLQRMRRNLRRTAPDGFAEQLMAALAAAGDSSRDLVLLHSVSAANLAGLAAALPAARLGALVIVLRRTPAEMDRDDPGPLPIPPILTGLAAHFGKQLRLLADTPPLARLWSKALNLPVATAPLPVVAPPVRDAPPGRPPHLLFAGGARVEKGYGLLPELVQGLAGEARFTIHSGPVDTAADPVVQHAHRRLRALSGPGLTLLERPLPPAEYLSLLHAADLVLLPYDARAYGPRSSGILAEARAAGVPAVVPADCWMADAVGPDPALTFRGGATGFLAAVRGALARLPALQHESAAAAPAWRQLHSPAALLLQLLGETV